MSYGKMPHVDLPYLSRRIVVLIVSLSLLYGAAWAQQKSDSSLPGREENESDTADNSSQSTKRTADWLYLAFEQRTRYETLDNRFRFGETGSDQQIALRTRLRLGIVNALDPFRFLIEIEDARVQLNDSGSAITNQMVNEYDFLQLYVSLAFKKTFQWNLPSAIYLGRQSFDMGSRRLFARNRYRNTTNAFNGLRWTLGDEHSRQLHLFLLQPVARRMYQPDHGDRGSYLWGAHISTYTLSGLSAEAYYFGIREDPLAASSQKRRYDTLGGRLYRNASPGKFHYEFESVWQKGKHATLDHFAHFQHASFGYKSDMAWKPVVTLKYDYASGDRDPNDNKDGSFDTLFGARRFDYGTTGIYGAFYRSNINSPAVAFEFNPVRRFMIFPIIRWIWLAQAEDRWVGSGLRDSSGKSGSHLGSQLEIRLSYSFGSHFRPEIGYLRLFKGSYEKLVPGSPPARDSNYLYIELNFSWDPLLH